MAAPVLASAASSAVQDVGRGDNCVTCHFGIEDMHPWEPISCTECHGGDGEAETKEAAHVQPKRKMPNDERVLPLDFDPDYLRFMNPSNLRVLDKTCGVCHQGVCDDLEISLHGTTAGHLCDGMYECGVTPERGSRFGMFLARAEVPDEADEPEELDAQGQPVEDPFAADHGEALDVLYPLPSFDPRKPRDEFATHYRDLPAKNCVRCHLWAPGVAIRGRLGLDGDYRSEGCAACHVTYANDGLAHGGDPTVDRFEPGHPVRHQLTSAPPTDTCTHCHYGDASIGLNFRGLAQLYPGQPAGPEVPGTTDAQLNQAFYINDPNVTPPDVHHERGMHCIDCHTSRDIMGDGRMVGQMPQAVEIECTDCHGTLGATSNLKTSRGNRIENIEKDGARFFLVSKVTGKRHVVKQTAHVINPRHQDYNPKAAKAMTSDHGRLECYTCHGGWSPNFFGFHFDRNEQFSQLDMMTGDRTSGRVTTQEKVFATFRGLYLGWNTDDMIAPYMVGFSSMGSVHDESGELVLDQAMPVTANGLSGMTLIHHQLHTTRSEARACADCHRSPTALGLGSPNGNFALGREFMVVGSSRGIDVMAMNRRALGDSAPIATLPMLGVRDVELECEPLQGHAVRAYVAVANRGIAVVDFSNPAFPTQVGLAKSEDPRASVHAASKLFVADGIGGVKIFDVKSGARLRQIAHIPTPDARDLELYGSHLYVADYQLGLFVIDVARPTPQVVARLDLTIEEDVDDEALKIAIALLPSRPIAGDVPLRTPTRVVAALACRTNGLKVVDITQPDDPQRVLAYNTITGRRRNANLYTTGVAAFSKVDLGSPDGAIPTVENDYLAITTVSADRQRGRLTLVRITDPIRPRAIGEEAINAFADDVEIVNVFNPPFLQQFALVPAGDEFQIVDISKSDDLSIVAEFGGMRGAKTVAVERMRLDRLVDEAGSPWKDISHEGARYFSRLEIEKILRAPILRSFEQVGPVTPAPLRRQR